MPPAGLVPYGEGVFRRRFVIRTLEGRRVAADLEDDFHRFHLELEHDGDRVTALRGEAVRYPWSECPGAESVIQELVGARLTKLVSAAASGTNPRSHCTHLFDMAVLAMTHVAQGRNHQQIDIAIPDRIENRTRPALARDGHSLFEWDVLETTLMGPEPFKGHDIRGGAFLRWAEAELEPDQAEAAITLRRACFISMVRLNKRDDAPNAAIYLDVAANSCHSFTPGIAERATRMQDTSRDFTHDPDGPLSDLVGTHPSRPERTRA